MIRRARKTDFPFVFPILQQIFDEMQMDTIAALAESTFYDLMKLGFYSERYRYSYKRIWVEVDKNDQVRGILAMYNYEDQKFIDLVLKPLCPKVGLATNTVIFSDQEAWPGEWYVDALATKPKYWGRGIGGNLLEASFDFAKKHGYKCVSLNVDKENPRAQRLYEHKGFETVKTMTIGDRSYNHMIKKIN